MSLISDALKRAEQQRVASPLARLTGWNRMPPAHVRARTATTAPSSRALMFANVVVLAAVCATALYFLRDRPIRTSRPVESVAASSDSAIEKPPVVAPIEDSPPSQPTPVAVVSKPAATEYDLGGTSSLGANTLLSIVRRSDQRSIWIPVGKTVGEVTAVSYDPATDRAVIRVRGNLLSVTMRDGVPPGPAQAPQAAE
jgi:hypothetical protein